MHVPGVGAYRIRPPNIPQGMNDHTRGRVFATDGGAWRAYAIRPLPGQGSWPGTRRGARPFLRVRVPGRPVGVCDTPLPYRQEGLPVPGQTWLASLTPPAFFCVYESATSARHYDTIISLYSL